MNLDNPVNKLCMEGTQAEFQGGFGNARILYQQAWDAAHDEYGACIAAHYVARHHRKTSLESNCTRHGKCSLR